MVGEMVIKITEDSILTGIGDFCIVWGELFRA